MKNKNVPVSKLIPSAKAFASAGNARAPKADVTNAPELFGDPSDDEFGDPDMYGEPDDDFGDAEEAGDPTMNESTIAMYNLISGDPSFGDPDMYGAPNPRLIKAAKTLGIVGAAGLATGLTHRALLNQVQRRIKTLRADRNFIQKKLSFNRLSQTLFNQDLARKFSGKIDRRSKVKFFQVTGAKMNSSPIDPMEGYIADMLKYNLDRQASDTPFYQESASGVFALGVWTATATGVPTPRYYTGLIIQLGINQLNAAPGTVFQITATLPTINGTLVVSATPWVFTIMKQFDVRFILYPWQLVSNKPLPVLGQYSNANPITVVVSGLPSASAVTLVVPGSLHPWTIALRNGLMRR